MAVNLRSVLDSAVNVDTEELIEDTDILQFYRQVVNWYRKYRLFPKTDVYNYSIQSGDYVPEILMDQEVVIEGETKKLSDIVDTETRIFNGTGTIQLTIALTADNAYLSGLPFELQQLFVAYCRKAIGERLSFAKYPSQPLELDAEYWKSKGEADIEKWEHFIMENRDEDPKNITDLRNEAYTGVRNTIFIAPGFSPWR